MAKAIYNYHKNGKTAINHTKGKDISMLRLYAKNMQPASKYMPESAIQTQSDLDTSKISIGDYERVGFGNINWRPISVVPKIFSKIHGMFDNAELEIVANAVDEKSRDDKEYLKWGMWVQAKYAEFFKLNNALAQTVTDTPPFIPEDVYDLELYAATEGYKLPIEIALEMLIKHTFQYSNWKEISKLLIDDILTHGNICIRAEVDPLSKKVKAKYVDPHPDNFFIQYDKDNNYQNAEYAGEIYRVSLTKARIMMLEAGITSDIVEQLVLSKIKETSYLNQYEYDKSITDDIKVELMHFEVLDVVSDKKLMVINRYGKTKVLDIDYNDYVKETEKQKVLYDNKVRKFSGDWIIGTDVILNWGLSTDIIYQADNPQLSYKFIKLNTPAIVEQIYMFIDHINNSWFKVQNAIAWSRPNIMTVNWDILQEIRIGGQLQSPMEVLKLALETGFLLWKSKDSLGNNNTYNQPISEIGGGAGNMLREAIEQMTFGSNMIYDITGINPIAMGNTPEPRTGKANVEMALQSSSDILKPYINNIFDLKDMFANYSANAITHHIRTSEKAYNSYANIIGKPKCEMLRTSSFNNVQWGITFESKSDSELRATIRQYILEALSTGRDGVASIGVQDAIKLETFLENGGSLKYAAIILNKAIEKEKQRREMAAQAASRQNHEQTMVQLQSKTQAEMQYESFKRDNIIKIDNNKSLLKIREIYYENYPNLAKFAVQDLQIPEMEREEIEQENKELIESNKTE
jgi:hypothetical protein